LFRDARRDVACGRVGTDRCFWDGIRGAGLDATEQRALAQRVQPSSPSNRTDHSPDARRIHCGPRESDHPIDRLVVPGRRRIARGHTYGKSFADVVERWSVDGAAPGRGAAPPDEAGSSRSSNGVAIDAVVIRTRGSSVVGGRGAARRRSARDQLRPLTPGPRARSRHGVAAALIQAGVLDRRSRRSCARTSSPCATIRRASRSRRWVAGSRLARRALRHAAYAYRRLRQSSRRDPRRALGVSPPSGSGAGPRRTGCCSLEGFLA